MRRRVRAATAVWHVDRRLATHGAVWLAMTVLLLLGVLGLTIRPTI